ncbi:MAG: FliM/FliN family flagellar motor C-terminal domain-containing protein [Sphingomonas sp.]
MQKKYRSWLPEAALRTGRVDNLLEAVARTWSATWFARANARPLAAITPLPTHADLGGGGTWLTLDRHLALGVPAASRLALAGMMLDTPNPPELLTESDQQLIDTLSSTCLDDLGRRVAEMFALAAASRWATSATSTMPEIAEPRGCSLGLETRTPLIRIVASTEQMVALTRAGLPPPPARNALRPIAAGLSGQSIVVSASLGRSAITLADMAGLSNGDVLVFDSKADAPLAIAVNGKPASRGRCTVAEVNGDLQLKLLEPVR